MKFIHADPNSWFALKPLARQKRKIMTEAEKIIWDEVRNSSLGYRIRRQHVIGKYIVDFVYIEKRLIIEIDGEYHDYNKDYDIEREKDLFISGFKIIRFKNEEVINSIDDVVRKIRDKLEASTSPLTPSAEGEGDKRVVVRFFYDFIKFFLK